MANNNIGPKRLVVGAHYGLRDWLAQRVTRLAAARMPAGSTWHALPRVRSAARGARRDL